MRLPLLAALALALLLAACGGGGGSDPTPTPVPLTTVAQDKFRMGAVSAERLLDRIAGTAGEPQHVRLPPRLEIRNSTAQPKRRK